MSFCAFRIIGIIKKKKEKKTSLTMTCGLKLHTEAVETFEVGYNRRKKENQTLLKFWAIMEIGPSASGILLSDLAT